MVEWEELEELEEEFRQNLHHVEVDEEELVLVLDEELLRRSVGWMEEEIGRVWRSRPRFVLGNRYVSVDELVDLLPGVLELESIWPFGVRCGWVDLDWICSDEVGRLELGFDCISISSLGFDEGLMNVLGVLRTVSKAFLTPDTMVWVVVWVSVW